jgi:DNA-binding YbaB/EbfC family protein
MNPRDLQKMQQQLMKAQQQMAQAQEKMAADLANMTLEGSAGGGAVTLTLSGDYQVRGVTIDPDAVDPEDVGALEDLISAALTDVLTKVAQAQEDAQQQMQATAMSGLKLPPGMGF